MMLFLHSLITLKTHCYKRFLANFKTVTVWIKFRPRKLGQYVEVMKERTTDTTISIRYSDDIYIPHIKEVLKEHKIKMMSNDHNVMVCKTPRPSDQHIEIAVQKIKVLANTARSSLSQGKAAEIQRCSLP